MAAVTEPTTIPTSVHYLHLKELHDDPLLKGLYSPINGDQWTDFKSSIANNEGCRVPILVLRIGQKHYVWDGYQRLEAHRQLKIDYIPAIHLPGGNQNWTDEQKVLWAADLNEHRRHDLTVRGRALLYIAKAPDSPHGKTQERKGGKFGENVEKPAETTVSALEGAHGDDAKKSTEKPTKTEPENQPEQPHTKTASGAAKESGFGSTRSAQKAAHVEKQACTEVRDAWEAEHISTNEAYEIVTKLGPSAQPFELEKLLRSKAERKATKEKPKEKAAKGKPVEAKLSVEDVAPALAQTFHSLARKFNKAKVFAVTQLSKERVEKIAKWMKANAEDASQLRSDILAIDEAVHEFAKIAEGWS